MKKSLVLGLLAATALANFANAEDNKYYAQFNLGGSLAMNTKYESKVNNVNFSYDGSPGIAPLFGAEIGTKVTDQFRIGLSLDYRMYHNYVEGKNKTTEGHLKTNSLVTMANAYYDFTKGSGFNPYVTVGLGIAKNEQKIDSKSDNRIGFDNKKTSGFAYKLGLGTKYTISNSFDIDLRYQFVDLGKVELGNAHVGNRSANNTTTKSGKLRANEVLLGIAYKF